MKQIDEIAMRNASIFELRNMARDVGVRSPTTYKKEDLINKIMQIITGEVKPELPKSRQGRPPKVGNKFFDKTDNSFGFNDFGEEGEKYDVGGFIDGKQLVLSDDGVKFGNSNTKYREGSGLLKLDKNGYGFLFKDGYVADANTAIHVPNSFIKDCNLREGDKVDCTYKEMDTQDVRWLTNVENASEFKTRTNFEDLKVVKNDSFLSLDAPLSMKVSQGERIVLRVGSLKDSDKMLSSFDKLSNDYSVFCLNLDALPEMLPFKFETFYTFAGDSEKKNIFTTELFIDRIKRLVEKGKKVIVFVNDLMKIVKYQNFANDHSIFDVKNKSFELCLRILRLASNYENGGSVTVFALMKENKLTNCNDYLACELENLNAKIIKLS
jgi:transcription termination factor Rho